MAKMESFKPGTFCWVDYAASDQPKAKEYYSKLFGWEVDDMPIGEGVVYSMMKKGGLDVAAIAPQQPEMEKLGVPSAWNSYICVEDVDAVTAKAKELGGKVLSEPMDVMDVGRMAAIADPQGGVFMPWQPKKHKGAGLVNEPGSFAWNELMAHDVDVAKKFYSDLFGWTVETEKMPDGMEYTTFTNGDRPAGGMMKILPEWGEMPSVWGVYFAVADCDESVSKAKELGGKLDGEVMDVPDVGKFAMLSDATGGHFSVIQMQEQPQ